MFVNMCWLLNNHWNLYSDFTIITQHLFHFSLSGFINFYCKEERKTDQVGEVVSILSGHQPAGVAESGDVLDVGLKSWRISLQHDVNERGEKVVGGRRLVLGDPNSAEDVFTAACDAGQFVPRNPLRIHLNDIWNRPRFAHEGWNKELIRLYVY